MEESRVKLQDGEMHYLKEGKGPPLLLLHSAGASAQSWRKVTGRLGEKFTVYALDLMGHGNSAKPLRDYSVPDYASSALEFMDMMQVGEARVVGNSIGALITIEMVASQPRRVARLVLVGCPAWENQKEKEERLALSLASFDKEGNPVPATLESLAMHYAHPTPELVAEVNAERARAGPWVKKAILAVFNYDVIPKLASISCPTLAVYGGQDFLKEHEKVLRRRIKGCRSFIVPEAGHLPQAENPRAFLQGVLPFLTGQER